MHPATVAYRRRLVATTGAGSYAAFCAAVAGVDSTARLPGVAVPALVIAGALDAGTPLAMSQQIADALPNACLAVIPEASHLSAIEQAVGFAAQVDEFLKNL